MGHADAMAILRRRTLTSAPSFRSLSRMVPEADVEGLIGAGRHERSAERLNWRNGYRERTLDTASWLAQPENP